MDSKGGHVATIELKADPHGTHSVRKVLPAVICRQTDNLEIWCQMLGHQSITMTQRYLGVEEAEVLEAVRRFRV